MDIYGLLQDDHRLVEDLIDEIEQRGAFDAELFARMRDELLQHSQAEDETLYEALAQTPEGASLIEESRQDHQAVEGMMDELANGGISAEGEGWRDQIDALEGLVADHVSFEEDEVIPLAQRLFSDEQAEQLGERFQARKDELSVSRTGHV